MAPAGVLLVILLGAAPWLPARHATVAQSASVSNSGSVVTAPDSDRLIFLTTHHLVAAAPTPAPPQQNVAVAARKTTARAKPPAPSSGTVAAATGQLGLINQDRAAAGLPPLQWNPCLAAVATQNAQRMAAQGFISHAGGPVQDLACHLGSRTGENIGYVGGGPNDAMMNTWFMGDAPHRANILGPYHYVGSAWVIAGNGTAYLAVEFG